MIGSLLGNHDSESVEVSQGLLSLSVSDLLSPGGLLPGLDDTGLSESLLENSSGASTADGDVEVSQRQPTDGELLSLNT